MNEHSAFWLAGDNLTGKSQKICCTAFSLKQTFNGFTFYNPVTADSFQHILGIAFILRVFENRHEKGSQKDFMEDFRQFSS